VVWTPYAEKSIAPVIGACFVLITLKFERQVG